MQLTPLASAHEKLGAVMVPFSGWKMPLHYGSQIEEHRAVREAAGVFDVSHMVLVDLTGPDALAFCRLLFANDAAKLSPSRALYTPMLSEAGGILDDLIVYQLDQQHYRIVTNAGTREKDLAWLNKQVEALDLLVTLEVRDDLALLAVQGPAVKDSCPKWLPAAVVEQVKSMKPFHCLQLQEYFISTTGYTGEAGFEIAVPKTQVLALWDSIVASGIRPIGLGARDSLRLEAGLNLYGADMDEGVTPDESNIGWTVDLKDPSRAFIGREAVEANRSKPHSYLMGAVLEQRGTLKAGLSIFSDEIPIGTITSAAWSVLLSRGIAMVRVNRQVEEASVQLRGKSVPISLHTLPFYKNGNIIVSKNKEGENHV